MGVVTAAATTAWLRRGGQGRSPGGRDRGRPRALPARGPPAARLQHGHRDPLRAGRARRRAAPGADGGLDVQRAIAPGAAANPRASLAIVLRSWRARPRPRTAWCAPRRQAVERLSPAQPARQGHGLRGARGPEDDDGGRRRWARRTTCRPSRCARAWWTAQRPSGGPHPVRADHGEATARTTYLLQLYKIAHEDPPLGERPRARSGEDAPGGGACAGARSGTAIPTRAPCPRPGPRARGPRQVAARDPDRRPRVAPAGAHRRGPTMARGAAPSRPAETLAPDGVGAAGVAAAAFAGALGLCVFHTGRRADPRRRPRPHPARDASLRRGVRRSAPAFSRPAIAVPRLVPATSPATPASADLRRKRVHLSPLPAAAAATRRGRARQRPLRPRRFAARYSASRARAQPATRRPARWSRMPRRRWWSRTDKKAREAQKGRPGEGAAGGAGRPGGGPQRRPAAGPVQGGHALTESYRPKCFWVRMAVPAERPGSWRRRREPS
jgi:hypothetical protein